VSRVIQREVLAKCTRRSAALLDFAHHRVGICPLFGGVSVVDCEARAGIS